MRIRLINTFETIVVKNRYVQSNPRWVVNNSNLNLDKEELSLLYKGFNFSLPNDFIVTGTVVNVTRIHNTWAKINQII